MKEKIKKILRVIVTIIAILWILGEIVFSEPWEEPSLTVMLGVLIMWGIATYSLKDKKQKEETPQEQ